MGNCICLRDQQYKEVLQLALQGKYTEMVAYLWHAEESDRSHNPHGLRYALAASIARRLGAKRQVYDLLQLALDAAMPGVGDYLFKKSMLNILRDETIIEPTTQISAKEGVKLLSTALSDVPVLGKLLRDIMNNDGPLDSALERSRKNIKCVCCECLAVIIYWLDDLQDFFEKKARTILNKVLPDVLIVPASSAGMTQMVTLDAIVKNAPISPNEIADMVKILQNPLKKMTIEECVTMTQQYVECGAYENASEILRMQLMRRAYEDQNEPNDGDVAIDFQLLVKRIPATDEGVKAGLIELDCVKNIKDMQSSFKKATQK